MNVPPKATPVAGAGRRSAVQLEARTDTMEDYLETQVPPLSQELAGRFLVVQDLAAGGPAELLTVDDKGRLSHFVPDEASQSGWRQYAVPVPGGRGPVTALRGFYRDGMLYTFVHYAAAKSVTAADTNPERGAIFRVVPMIRDRDGNWSRMPLSGSLTNVLAKVRQLDVHLDGDGNPYLYGLTREYSPEAFFVVTQDRRGQWQVVHLESAAGYSAYRLVAGLGDEQMTVLRVAGPSVHYRAGSIRMSGGRRKLVYGADPWKDVNLRHGDLALDQVIPFPKRHQGLDFLLLSSHRHLDHVILRPERTPKVMLLSGRSDAPRGSLDSVALSVDAAGLYTIFAVARDDRRLWVLRQKSGRKKVEIDYFPWSEIGDRYRAIAAPVSLARGAELFGVDMERRVLHAHQPFESETDVWQRTILESPKSSGAPQRCTTHNLELTALDAAGQPVADTIVHVRADRVTTIYVNGVSYRVGPEPLQPVALSTNTGGRLSLRVPCRRQTGNAEGTSFGLTAPVITARLMPSGGQPFERSYAPDLAFYKRVANLDGEHPMTAERLIGKGFLPQGFDPDQADVIAASAQQVGKNMVLRFAHQDPELAALAAAPFAERSWEFDFKGPGGVRVRELTPRQFDAVFSAAPKSIGRALGDLFRWIANTAKAITKVVFKVTAKLVELVIETARGIQRFVLDAAAQAAEFLNGLFKSLAELANKIKDAAAALIQMFEALLDFEDILITKDVLKVGFDSFVRSLERSLSHGIPEYLNGKFQEARRQLDQSFGEARARLEGKNLEQIARESGGGHGIGNNPYAAVMPGHAVRGGFVAQFTTNALDGSTARLRWPKLSSREQKALDRVLAELTKIYEDNGLEARAKAIREDLKTIFERPENLLRGTLKLLLNLLHGVLDLALRIANTLINLILKLLGHALGLLRQLFNQTIPIPVVSALYKQMTGSDLTLIDLSLLIVAVPGTILYKVITGLLRPGQPLKRPFERRQIETVQKLFGKFGDLRRMIEGPSGAKKLTAAERKATKELMLVFGIVGGCAVFLYTYFEMYTDAIAATPTPRSELDAAPAGVSELGAISTLVGLVMIFLATPISSLNKSFRDRSTAEHYGLALWFARFVPLTLNALVASATKGSKALKGIPKIGPGITVIIGVVAAAAATVVLAMQAGAGNVAGVLSAIGAICAGSSDISRVCIPLVQSTGAPWNLLAAIILFGVVSLSGRSRAGLTIAAAIAAFQA